MLHLDYFYMTDWALKVHSTYAVHLGSKLKSTTLTNKCKNNKYVKNNMNNNYNDNNTHIFLNTYVAWLF